MVQKAGAGETGLPILCELSYCIFLKASVSNAPGLSIKLFDKKIIDSKVYQTFQHSVNELLLGSKYNKVLNISNLRYAYISTKTIITPPLN